MRKQIILGNAIWIAAALGAGLSRLVPARSAGGGQLIFHVSTIVGDERLLTSHVDQNLINSGAIGFPELVADGEYLFNTAFTEADGRGRPATNGTFPALARTPLLAPQNFNRISGPDSDSCNGCHAKPRNGGGGDNVANVFVLGQRFSFFNDPSQPDENGTPAPGTLENAADERNTLGMFGSGAIEMLAREMTGDLLAIQAQAVKQAATSGAPVTLPLLTKGVSFGSITANANGTLNTSAVEGVNTDLIIRPFSWKGVVESVRVFTNNAFPQHFGLEPTERFGVNTDPDGDGITNELSVGDITACTIFQEQLGIPGQVIPRNQVIASAIRHGSTTFNKIGCATCHIPALTLNNPIFSEPNPYNPAFNLQPNQVPRPFQFDLTTAGELPRLQRQGGHAIVRAFTDLKRHNMGTNPMIANETVVQNGVPTNVFLTKKLWGFYTEPHFLHNGCATLIDTAIRAHGGDSQQSADNYAALSNADQRNVIEFLKSLRTLPAGTPSLVVDEFGQPVPPQ